MGSTKTDRAVEPVAMAIANARGHGDWQKETPLAHAAIDAYRKLEFDVQFPSLPPAATVGQLLAYSSRVLADQAPQRALFDGTEQGGSD